MVKRQKVNCSVGRMGLAKKIFTQGLEQLYFGLELRTLFNLIFSFVKFFFFDKKTARKRQKCASMHCILARSETLALKRSPPAALCHCCRGFIFTLPSRFKGFGYLNGRAAMTSLLHMQVGVTVYSKGGF